MLSLDWSLLFTVINLVIFYLLLRKFLFKPIDNIIAKREQLIKEQFAAAEKKCGEADDLFARYRASLDNLTEEGERIKKASREEGRAEYSRIVGEANKQAVEIIDKAKITAEGEYRKVVENARQQIAEMAETAAQKIVNEKDVTVDNKSLYDAFLTKADGGQEGK